MRLEQATITDLVARLRRAEGQLRGVVGMLEQGRDCAEVATQLAAVSRALDRAGFKLIASGLQQCLAAAEGDPEASIDQEKLERVFLSLA